jgi:hypothetical protein
MRLILMTILLFAAASANAIPVVWEFSANSGYEMLPSNGVPFDGAVTGSFVYDADASIYERISSVNVTASAGTYTSGYACDSNSEDPIVNSGVCLTGVGSGLRFIIDVDAPLTNAGGTVNLQFNPFIGYPYMGIGSGEATCESTENGGCYFGTYYETFAGGSLIGTVVPVPAAVWLFGSALAGLGWMKRKQAA